MKSIFSGFLLVILISFSFPDLVLSTNNNHLINQLQVFDNDSTFRYSYLYDDAGHIVLETKFLLQNNMYIRKSLTEWIFDGNKCINQREQMWKNNMWNDSYSIHYNYANDLLITEIDTSFSETTAFPIKKIDYQYKENSLISKKEYSWRNSQWHLSISTDFSYSTEGKPDSAIISTYQSDCLSSQFLFTFQYNSNGQLYSQILKQKNGQVWVNSDLITWYYYSNSYPNQIQTQKNKKWNSETSQWENLQRIDYQYNTVNQITTEVYQNWKNMCWENDIRYDYSYDGNNMLTKKMLSEPIYNDWRSLVSINYSDFISDKATIIQSQYEFWGGNTAELTTSFIPFMFNDNMVTKKARSLQIAYIQFNDSLLSIPTIKPNRVMAYPNPSNGIYYFNSNNNDVKSWTISDLNGKILKNEDRSIRSGVIDIVDFPKGIYILKITTSDISSVQKLFKQ
jgi:hypothetical protein